MSLNAAGTQLHGLFESGASRRHVLDWVRGTPAAPAAPAPDHRAPREAAYERLADALDAALDPSVLSGLGVA
jgi:cobyric acid synthase